MRWFVLGFSPIFPLARTTSPRRLSSSVRKPSSLPDIPSLLAVSNCRSSCSQVLSASFFSSWDRTLSLTTSFGLAKCASGFSTLSFAFDVFAIGCLLAGDYTTTTPWRDLEFLQNYGHGHHPQADCNDYTFSRGGRHTSKGITARRRLIDQDHCGVR